ncbi:MAG: hypothetical protein ACPG49_02060 [Chitinophagales bacterium]
MPSKIVLFLIALVLCGVFYTWLNKRSVRKANEQFGWMAEELGVEMIAGSKKGEGAEYPQLKGQIEGVDFDMYVKYSNNKMYPDQIIAVFQLSNIEGEMKILPSRPLQKPSIPTGIKDFDKSFKVYSNRTDWIPHIFTPSLTQGFVALQKKGLMDESRFILEKSELRYERNLVIKSSKDARELFEEIEVAKNLVIHLSKKHPSLN